MNKNRSERLVSAKAKGYYRSPVTELKIPVKMVRVPVPVLAKVEKIIDDYKVRLCENADS